MKVEVYKDASGDHRWRLRNGKNGRVMADSGEGYKRRAGAVAAWKKIEYFVVGKCSILPVEGVARVTFTEMPIQDAEVEPGLVAHYRGPGCDPAPVNECDGPQRADDCDRISEGEARTAALRVLLDVANGAIEYNGTVRADAARAILAATASGSYAVRAQ